MTRLLLSSALLLSCAAPLSAGEFCIVTTDDATLARLATAPTQSLTKCWSCGRKVEPRRDGDRAGYSCDHCGAIYAKRVGLQK